MDDGSAGLETLAGDGDGGQPAPDDAMALEECDLGYGVWRGVVAEKMGDGGATDAAADDADSVGVGVGL